MVQVPHGITKLVVLINKDCLNIDVIKSRNKYRNKWWVKPIRFMNYLAFRYWWFVWSFFIISLLLLYFFCCNKSKNSTAKNTHCPEKDVYFNNMREIDSLMLNCCECTLDTISKKEDQVIDSLERDQVIDSLERDSIPQAPSENCRVHFSGLFMGDSYKAEYISEIYKIDDYSEYVGSGYYPDNNIAFPKSVDASFDGIAIDKGTRLIIYSKKDFQGEVLLDISGPAIINNVKHIDNSAVNFCNTMNFKSSLQNNYPQSVRKWSKSNMWDWSYGSCKIICSE